MLGKHLHREKNATEVIRCNRVLVVTERFSIVVNDFNANISVRHIQIPIVTELVIG